MKKHILPALLFAILLAIPSAVTAQDARQMLNHLYINAGQMPISDFVIELEEMGSTGGSSMSLNSRDKMYFMAPNKIRVDAVISDPGGPLDGKNVILIRDGINAWQYLSTGQYPVKKKLDEPSPPLNIPFGIVRYPQDVDKKYSVAGKETVEGVQCTKILIQGKEEITVWIDTNRWIPLKQLIKVPGKDGKSTTKTALYKDIGTTKDGRYFPMKIEVYTDDALTRLVVFKGVAINAGIKETMFEPMEKFLK